MLTDAIRLILFPALMAFAASSDLFTMTISNRLSLALAGGFVLLALVTGMSLPAAGMHLAAAATPSSRPQPRCGSASITCSTTCSMPRCSAAR